MWADVPVLALASPVLWPCVSAANQPGYTGRGREAEEESEGRQMTKDKAGAITRDRLARWGAILKEHVATPVLVLGVGHGPKAGELSVCCTEDMSNEQLLLFVKAAFELIIRRLDGERAVMDPRVNMTPEAKGGA